jgi:hypothetical protein
MVKEVNSAVTLDDKETISSYRAYHSYMWNCSSTVGIVYMESIATNNTQYSLLYGGQKMVFTDDNLTLMNVKSPERAS